MLSLLIAATVIAAPLPERDEKRCPANPGVFDAAATSPGRMQRLDELPPAAHVLSVYREVARCAEPVVLRTGIGNPRN